MRWNSSEDAQDLTLRLPGFITFFPGFDQSLNLAAILPQLGYGSQGRRVPGEVYFDLATWQLVNPAHAHIHLFELREMISMCCDGVCCGRLIIVVSNILGHNLAALAEQTKIDVALNGHSLIDVSVVEDYLQATFSGAQQANAIEKKVSRIVGHYA